MPRSFWKGAINFGLVHIPVKMYKAASGKDIRFRELHDKDHAPLKQKRVCSLEGREVEYKDVVKGYEVAPDEYVVVKPEELDALETAAGHSIDIESFVDLPEVDPVYFERSYYLVPEKNSAKAYSLLRAAMEEANKAAIARMILRQRQHLVLVRASGHALALSTLFYANEVVAQDELDGLPEKTHVDKRELAMAMNLIESLDTEFDPERYHDEYREKVLELIDQKAEGKKVSIQKPRKEPARVIDLMTALQASLDKAKGTETPAKKPAKSHKKAGTAKPKRRKAA
jgi:DNA end-binding protein Ku